MKADIQKEYDLKLQTPEQASRLVHSGDRVFIGFASSITYTMANALWERRGELEDVQILCSNCLLPTPLLMDSSSNPFSVSTPFLGPGERAAVRIGRKVAFTSVHLSQVDRWVKETGKPTVAFFSVSPPDEDGYMSFGPSGICVNQYVKETADRIVVHVNRQVPRVFGQFARIHISEADAVVEAEENLPELPEDSSDETIKKISDHVLGLIPDGATIQLGIGKLSTAIGYGLREKNDLGIHSELFSEPMVELIRNGNVTNTQKGFMDEKSVFAFAMGSRDLYSFMDGNETLYGGTFPWVNDPRNISQNKKMISVNSAMALDLYGQVAADALGWKQHSAVGGQLDFIRGAQWSEGGKAVIATTSSFIKDGERRSKIVLNFPAGTAVTTPRSEVNYVVTEYGCADLKALTMEERVRAMISLAHPDFRDQLIEEAKFHRLLN